MQKIYLVGNPNCGKTTFYNKLTKSDEHIGNYNGVTVDVVSKVISVGSEKFEIFDLPGTYSLSPFSLEEKTTCDFLLKELSTKRKSDFIINICDKRTLSRALNLCLQLLESGYKTLLFINIMDKEYLDKSIIDNIQKVLGIVVIQGSIVKIKNLQFVLDKNNFKISNNFKYTEIYSKIALNLDKVVPIKVCENDSNVKDEFNLSDADIDKIKKQLSSYGLTINGLYSERKKIIDSLKIPKSENIHKTFLDNVLLNKYFAIPFFLIIMSFGFYLTFSSVGAFLSNLLNSFFSDFLPTFLNTFFTQIGLNEIFISFMLNGVVAGAGSVLCFLPQIVMLFIFISILENSGYLPKLAFILDDLFSKFGLNGKSLFTLIMSFGCATSAMLTAKNQDNAKLKAKTMILAQYISCSAKLPIFAVLCGAFFMNNVLYIMCLYIIGILLGVLVAFILKQTKLNTISNNSIIEIPKILNINVKNILKVAYKNSLDFLTRVGGIILLFTIIIWFLKSFSYSFKYVEDEKQSVLYFLGSLIAPLFAPLGFNNYGVAVALLMGVVAKELILSTLSMFNSMQDSLNLQMSLTSLSSPIFFTNASALSFLVFVLLYSPCISSLSVMKKEMGFKLTLIASFIQFLVAYTLAVFVYALASLINLKIFILVAIILILFLIIFLCLSRANKCDSNCKNCKKYCKFVSRL